MRRCFAILSTAVLALSAGPVVAHPALVNPTTGAPAIKSIDSLSFGSDGLLLIGDGVGTQLIAVETNDNKVTKWNKTEIKDIQTVLAGRLGTTAAGIQINKMAVHPISQKAYFAVRGLDMKKDVILTVDGDGKVAEFELDKVKHVAVPLPADQKVQKITDVTWAGDRVLVAAQAKDTFGSKIFSLKSPISGDGTCVTFSTETYHVAHGKWETSAPIRTVIPYESKGKKYLVGAFTCTPIVKYALDDLISGAKVKGTSVVELGNGNTPLDMFIYEKGGKKYILMNHLRGFHKQNPVGPSEYWTAKVDLTLLDETVNINEKALLRTTGKDASKSTNDRAVVVETFHFVKHMDRINNEQALVLRVTADKKMDLAVLALP